MIQRFLARKWLVSLFLITGLSMMFVGGCGDTVQTDKTLIIATCEGSPPFSYMDDSNKLVGFNIDYSAELSKRIGREVEVQSVVWDSIIAGLTSGKYDMIVGTMSITPERAKAVHFTDVYFKDGTTVAVSKDSEVKTPEDLAGKRIGVGLGTNYADDAQKYIKNPVIVTYKTDIEQYQDLELGRIDAVVCSRYGMQYAKKVNNFTFRILDKNLYDDPCGIALRLGDDEIYAKVNQAVKDINADGTRAKLENKWFGN
jgi:ABC-type amino acid transport substrate-binding protein